MQLLRGVGCCSTSVLLTGIVLVDFCLGMGAEKLGQRGTAHDEKKKTRSRNTASQGTSLVTSKITLSVQDCNSCLPPF